ncbi:MAG TPA: hypothetical protein VFQ30_06500 [Ktedonobacteraceae bacterium]|nr:hypothetical protein [Ktedonobacteraceae bacterium]
MTTLITRWWKAISLGALALMALALMTACSINPSAYANSLANANSPAVSNATHQANSQTFTFKMVPAVNIASCLPKASGSVTVTTGSLNDTLKVSVSGLAPSTGYDFFIIQVPNKPFGISWYQSDVHTDATGAGSATVRGIFNKETFSVSLGGTTTFSPTHQYHLGLWFNNPKVPFNLGCEPGATSPIVTPFNGAQNAGIQALNTSNFPDNAGPLSQIP